jgi:iron complex outermembrane receptor protein
MKIMKVSTISLMLFASFAVSQQQPRQVNQPMTKEAETVVVTGTFEPIPLSEDNRSVLSFDPEAQSILYNSLVDYLHLDPSVDLRQRETDGVQADLSIRGASFGQSLVLLNGLRINDAQTGHHNMVTS